MGGHAVPLKLVPPKPGKTPNWYIRGTYLRVYVEESTGTPVEALAENGEGPGVRLRKGG